MLCAKYNNGKSVGRCCEGGARGTNLRYSKTMGYESLSFRAVWILFIILKTALKRDKGPNSISQTETEHAAVSHNRKFNTGKRRDQRPANGCDEDARRVGKKRLYAAAKGPDREINTFI